MVLLLGMLLYFGIIDNVSVFQAREDTKSCMITDYQCREIEDKDTPIGVKKEYSWTMEQIENGDVYLSFYVVHQYIDVYFNDELMYSLKPSTDNKIGKTTGSNWIMIPLYQEDSGKEVRVEVVPVYKSFRNRKIDFIIGSRLEIYKKRLKMDLLQMLFGVGACVIGIAFCVLAIYNLIKKKHGKSLVALGFFSIMLGLWRLSDMRITPLIISTKPVFLFYLSIGMLMIGGVALIKAIQKRFDRHSFLLFDLCSLIMSVVCILQLILQIFNVADLRELLYITHIMIFMTVLVTVYNLIYDRFFANKPCIHKKIVILCVAGVLADVVAFYLKGNSSGLIFTLALFLLCIIVIGITIFVDYLEQEKRLKDQEEELASSRIATMLSQIKPHFLLNCLITIKYLCKRDSNEAVEIIDRFSAFLRGSMDALTLKHNIPFERELDFVENYLYLEKKRFGDALQVIYDIQEKDFLIPALTVQPIVENAVRHGIRKKLEGGCVIISSFRDEDYYIVKVEDDGVGFDTDKRNDNDRNHVGIANVTTRLNIMCEGKLEITSVKNEGTSVLIKIPVEGDKVFFTKIS